MARCGKCGKEYEGAPELCPACGEPPKPAEAPAAAGGWAFEGGASPGAGEWPLDGKGEPVPPALLTTVMGSQLDYQMTLSLLRSFGIPALESYTSTGALAKVILGFAGTGMDVFVPETMLELARELLKPVDEADPEPAD
jgi:hypothetical protein